MGKAATEIFDRMITSRHWLYRPWIPFLKAIEGEAFLDVKLEKPVLDLACGDGVFTQCVFGNSFDAGFDLGFDDLAKAKAASTHDTLVQANAYDVPFRTGIFSSVISVCAIEHMQEIESVLKEVGRLLRPGGRFVFTVPSVYFGKGLLTPTIYRMLGMSAKADRYADRKNARSQHYHVLTLSEWKDLLRSAGLDVRDYRGVIDSRCLLLWSILGSTYFKLAIYPFRWLKSDRADTLLAWVLRKTLGGILERSSKVPVEGYGYLMVMGEKPAS